LETTAMPRRGRTRVLAVRFGCEASNFLGLAQFGKRLIGVATGHG
jgi:hypothetical protein